MAEQKKLWSTIVGRNHSDNHSLNAINTDPINEVSPMTQPNSDKVTDEKSFMIYLEQLSNCKERPNWANITFQKVLQSALYGLAGHSRDRVTPTPWYNEFKKKTPYGKIAALFDLGLIYE